MSFHSYRERVQLTNTESNGLSIDGGHNFGVNSSGTNPRHRLYLRSGDDTVAAGCNDHYRGRPGRQIQARLQMRLSSTALLKSSGT